MVVYRIDPGVGRIDLVAEAMMRDHYTKPERMSVERLEEIGRAKFGRHWRTPLGRAIGMTRVQLPAVYQWLDGTTPIPAHWAEKIEALIS